MSSPVLAVKIKGHEPQTEEKDEIPLVTFNTDTKNILSQTKVENEILSPILPVKSIKQHAEKKDEILMDNYDSFIENIITKDKTENEKLKEEYERQKERTDVNIRAKKSSNKELRYAIEEYKKIPTAKPKKKVDLINIEKHDSNFFGDM
jgi:hypothetical protein